MSRYLATAGLFDGTQLHGTPARRDIPRRPSNLTFVAVPTIKRNTSRRPPSALFVSPLCMFGESVFGLIPDHEVRAAKLTNRWISGCWWGRDTSSDEHLVGTKHGLLKCRSGRRKPPGEQWSRRETIEARGTKWNFDVEMDSGIPDQLWNHVEMEECRQQRHRWKFLQYLHLHLRLKNTYLTCEVKDCTRKH